MPELRPPRMTEETRTDYQLVRLAIESLQRARRHYAEIERGINDIPDMSAVTADMSWRKTAAWFFTLGQALGVVKQFSSRFAEARMEDGRAEIALFELQRRAQKDKKEGELQ